MGANSNAAARIGSGLIWAGLASAALPALASAQTPGEAPKVVDNTPKELDFEGDVVETNFLKPDGALIEGENRRGGSSLLKIRENFVPEIVRSAEDL